MVWFQRAIVGTLAMLVLGVLGIGSVDKDRMIDIIERHNAA